jgi:hypothetical protein
MGFENDMAYPYASDYYNEASRAAAKTSLVAITEHGFDKSKVKLHAAPT